VYSPVPPDLAGSHACGARAALRPAARPSHTGCAGADDARALAGRITADERTAIDTLAREELGIDPTELGGSAWEAAVTSFVLFAIGAAIPVVPFALLSGARAIGLSLLLSACALFALGAGITLLTGRGVLFSGSRQLLIGLCAAALTFGVGRLIGVSLGG